MIRSEEHTSELQSLRHLVCRLLLEKKKKKKNKNSEARLLYASTHKSSLPCRRRAVLFGRWRPILRRPVFFSMSFFCFFFFKKGAPPEIFPFSPPGFFPI